MLANTIASASAVWLSGRSAAMVATESANVAAAPASRRPSALPMISRVSSGRRTRSRTRMVSRPSWLRIARIPTTLWAKLNSPSCCAPR